MKDSDVSSVHINACVRDSELDKLERLCQEADPGDWRVVDGEVQRYGGRPFERRDASLRLMARAVDAYVHTVPHVAQYSIGGTAVKQLAMILALLLSACPLTVVDPPPPCSPCHMKCDQDWGDSCADCRAENCPDMTSDNTDAARPVKTRSTSDPGE